MNTNTLINKDKTKTQLATSFSGIAGQYGSAWLDSSLSFKDRGRFSFIARNPVMDILQTNNKVIVKKANSEINIYKNNCIYDLLESAWLDKNLFSIGYISYEAMLSFIGVKPKYYRQDIPSVRFLFYDSVLRLDHNLHTIAISNPEIDNYNDLFDSQHETGEPYYSSQPEFSFTTSQNEYHEKVNRIKWHIREGDIYQANFTTRIDINSTQNPFNIYKHLRCLNPSPYGCYINFSDYQILSSSPERMFLKQGDHITSAPIKGTIARGRNNSEEEYNLNKLLNSTKDKAELLMIVDLIRNDLGKIAKTGSVTVDTIYKPEIYSSLIHLVSDIKATLKKEIKITDIFQALFPGGSITGAPKKRAVEIINENENTPRGVYTGCIGYIYKDIADFNIAIRTITHKEGLYHVHAGGGIVADSDPEREYDEMILKAKNLLKAIGITRE